MKIFISLLKFLSFILHLFLFPIVYGQQNGREICIVAVGDIMPGTNFPSEKYLPPDSGKKIFEPVIHYLKNADIVFGNLEGCLLDSGGTVKRCKDTAKCYAFRIPVRFGKIIKNAGFNLLNLANNHSGDFGDAGRLSTMKTLAENNIRYAGLTDYPYTIFEEKNLKIGFCGFSPFNGTVDMLDTALVNNIVRKLSSECDIVIVSVHAGGEGAKYRNVTRKSEYFYDEDRGNIYEFAHMVIDNGADLVLGHGPHVTRAVELYKGRFIAYSLGNFCTYARFNIKGANGVAPVLKINLKPDGEFQQAEVFSIIQLNEGGPLPDKDNTALKQIIELTATDFPDTPLLIQENGIIKPLK